MHVKKKTCATTLEKRKQLKEITSNTITLRTMSFPALQEERELLLSWDADVKEMPTKTAAVKSELAFTTSSSAMTWMLVMLVSLFFC